MQPNGPAPTPSACIEFRPANFMGVLHTAGTVSITAASFLLSRSGGLAWIGGQVLLAVALVQWFIVLHECGHETMFRSSRLNSFAGHIAAFFSVIPFSCWKRVHASHHRWTGWQDLDPTTESLVRSPLGTLERKFVNTSWRFWIPAFSVIYRINNYWNLRRLRGLYETNKAWRRMVSDTVVLLTVYAAITVAFGPALVVKMTGLGVLLALVIEDPLILSQHTHIPQQVSRGGKVRPFGAFEQEAFTRSLKFPDWISKFVLLNFDAHELHHMYPFVPGYHLRRIPYTGRNEVHWWAWIRAVKRIRGEQFLFQNQNDSGIRV